MTTKVKKVDQQEQIVYQRVQQLLEIANEQAIAMGTQGQMALTALGMIQMGVTMASPSSLQQLLNCIVEIGKAVLDSDLPQTEYEKGIEDNLVNLMGVL